MCHTPSATYLRTEYPTYLRCDCYRCCRAIQQDEARLRRAALGNHSTVSWTRPLLDVLRYSIGRERIMHENIAGVFGEVIQIIFEVRTDIRCVFQRSDEVKW